MRNVLLYNGENELKNLFEIINTKAKTESTDTFIYSFDQLFSKCNKCPDIISKKSPFGSGSNRVMIILNMPRMINREDITKLKPESDGLLRKMISAIDLELKECYITNIIKCETNNVLNKPSDMLKNCLHILESEIDFIKPNISIVMGDILPLQKIVNSRKDITWFNIEHPVSLIKNPELKRSAWTTLKLVSKKFSET
ncbi:MAG: hypothetical protein FWH53_02935 [Leptospirales bacterium]|nr:hypothetical protein [Leptospirales bacterium]